VVTVGSRSVRTQFVPLHSIEWLDVTIDALESVNDASALERTIRTAFESAVEDAEFAGRRMLRVTLKGPTPLATKLIQQPYVKDVESDLKNELGVLDLEIVSSGVRPLIDVEQYRDGQHLLGEVLSLIEEVGENDALLDELGPVPIADVSSAADDRIAYLRTLLTDLSAEAASRLLVEEG